MSELRGLSWTLEVSNDVIAAMSPPIRQFFLALRQLHMEEKARGV